MSRAPVTVSRRFAVAIAVLCLGCMSLACASVRATQAAPSPGGSAAPTPADRATTGPRSVAPRGVQVLSAPRGVQALSAGRAVLAQLGVQQSEYLQIAEAGVTRAERLWRNRRLGWYDSRLHDGDRYPLATIWDATPLFEALSAIDSAAPSAAHRAAVVAFGRGAERYYDSTLPPMPGFAPYPGDRGRTRVWFDDNGWWGLAFDDAYRATGILRYRRDAERAFRFIAAEGWNRAGGGLWWNTSHPYIAGEPLAAAALLGARLYQSTGKPFYRDQVVKFLDWAEASFLTERRLYERTDSDPTPTPYIEGTLVEAHQALCETGLTAACARAAELADASAQRFADRLNMGPQFDTIYLHWMLLYGAQTGDTRWRALAVRMATQAQANARDAQGLYLRAWDGTPIIDHQAQPNMLQTDAATLELFAWLAATPG